MEFSPKLNILCGENAQGKTNLLESIWTCTGCRSFRGTRDRDFIGFDKEKAEIHIKFSDNVREQEIKFAVMKNNIKEKKVTLNGVRLPLLSRLFGSLKCVIFTPEDLELSKGSPEKRRLFLDISISQIKPSYISAKIKYDNLLNQRNALLKDIAFGKSDASMLDIWDEQLAEVGSYISVLRFYYTEKLNNYAKSFYNRLSAGKENTELYYNSTIFKNSLKSTDYKGELKDIYLKKLKESNNEDIRTGYTQYGIHRDDIIAKINNLNVREFGSQGQQRSVALVMKLSQAEILKDEIGEAPVILLDDVLSELDESRQAFIMNNIDNMQVFVSCCNPSDILKYKSGNVYFIENGSVKDIIYNSRKDY